jgi:hypothetical protein
MRELLRTLARRLGGVVAECNEAQRRTTVLMTSADRSLVVPGRAPDTYQDFLLRTSGPLVHEPPAASRLPGQPVR